MSGNIRVWQQPVRPEAVLEAGLGYSTWRVLAWRVPLDLPHPEQQQRLRGQLRHHPRELQQQSKLWHRQGHHRCSQSQVDEVKTYF